MNPDPLFPLGEIRITPCAKALLCPAEIAVSLRRHQHGDFGDIHPEDEWQNRRGLGQCGLIMSVYSTLDGITYWVQTHGSRSHTLILLPGE